MLGIMPDQCVELNIPAFLQACFSIVVSSNHPVFTSKKSDTYMTKLKLSYIAKEKRLWSINSLEASNGHSIVQSSLQVLLQISSSEKVWCIVCRKRKQEAWCQRRYKNTILFPYINLNDFLKVGKDKEKTVRTM